MSQWLRSVNSLLEKLDDHVESTDTTTTVTNTASRLTQRITSRLAGQAAAVAAAASSSTKNIKGRARSTDSSDDDDDYYDDDIAYDDDELEESGDDDEYYSNDEINTDDEDFEEDEYLEEDNENKDEVQDNPQQYGHENHEEEEETIELHPIVSPDREDHDNLSAVPQTSTPPQLHSVDVNKGKGSQQVFTTASTSAKSSSELTGFDHDDATRTLVDDLVQSSSPSLAAPESVTASGGLSQPTSQQLQQEKKTSSVVTMNSSSILPEPAVGERAPTTTTTLTPQPPPPPSLQQKPANAPSSANSSIGISNKATVAPTSHGSATASAATSVSAVAALKRDYKKAQQEIQRLEKLNSSLQTQLNVALTEIQAQSNELIQAGQSMEEERKRMEEEREDVLEEHEEEMVQLQEKHKQEIQQYQERIQVEELKRQQEGGDWTKELQDALNRERFSLQKINELENDKLTLQGQVKELEQQQQVLENKVGILTDTSRAATERAQQVEAQWDTSRLQHQHQLAQRQAREVELERTVAELGAALSAYQLQGSSNNTNSSTSSTSDNIHPTSRPMGRTGEETGEGSYEVSYQVAMEELETNKTQLSLMTQQCETLQNELQILAQGHTTEMAMMQQRQNEYDRQVMELTAKIKRLEVTARDLDEQQRDGSGNTATNTSNIDTTSDAKVGQLTHELTQTRRQLTSISDQLMRQQGLVESSKAEILTLKGRLQSAIDRAQAAENTIAELASNSVDTNRIYELEGGYTSTPSKAGVGTGRRRVKAGGGSTSSRYNQLPSRSMLSGLGLRVTSGGYTEQLAITIDAVDMWMLETGNILRHEPLARLGFALYFAMIHFFCFLLITFHTIESERSDLRTLSDRRHQQQQHHR